MTDIFLANCVLKAVLPEKDRELVCYISVLHTVSAMPFRDVGSQYYSLHFTQTAIKTIMVRSIAPCNCVNCLVHDDISIHKLQQHLGACVAKLASEPQIHNHPTMTSR